MCSTSAHATAVTHTLRKHLALASLLYNLAKKHYEIISLEKEMIKHEEVIQNQGAP